MLIAIDTETFLISEEEPIPQLVSIAIASNKTQELWGAHEQGLESRLKDVFNRGRCVFYNAPFDILTILRSFPNLEPVIIQAYKDSRVVDAMTCEKLIDIAEGEHRMRGGYDLGSVAKRRAGIDVDKNDPWRTRYHELLGVDPDKWPKSAQHYAEFDAWATLQLHVTQLEYAKKRGIPLEDLPNQARGHLALYTQSVYGVATDQGRVQALAEQLDAEIAEHKAACIEAGLMHEVGPKKSPRLARRMSAAREMVADFAAELGIQPEVTATGKVALSDPALKALDLPEGHPLDHYRQLAAKTNLRTKTIVPFQAPIVRTRYDELMSTGRTSSSAPKFYPGTNLQNLPRDNAYRQCLRARDGHTLVISDWGQAELVTLAQVQINIFGKSALADALKSGMDPHINMACQILGIEYAEYDGANPTHKDARQMAKAANFGFPGGLGIDRFCDFAKNTYGVTLTRYQAQKLKDQWLRQWPEMEPYFRYADRQRGTMVQHWSGRVRGGCRYTESCNTLFQGLAADAAKLTLWNLYLAGKNPDSTMYGSKQVLFVHDENVTEASIDKAEEVLKEQERIMVESFAVCCPDVPITVDSFISTNYKKD